MPHRLLSLLETNRRWSERRRAEDPGFFERLSRQQAPEYLWIGCSDSRVPANEIVAMDPGELFVHRNVANVVVHSDLNCLSVMQFAVDVLKVKHIIVCGHYGCGGVAAAYQGARMGLIDNWLRHVQDVRDKHAGLIGQASDEQAALDLMCELNVVEQVSNVCETTVVGDAWDRGQALTVHGWIYGLQDGLLRELGMAVRNRGELAEARPPALESLRSWARAGRRSG
jgi:carbonic anhydrase